MMIKLYMGLGLVGISCSAKITILVLGYVVKFELGTV